MTELPPNTSRSLTEETVQMSTDEKYLFDLTGFLVVRDVLSKEQLKVANAAIDSMDIQAILYPDTSQWVFQHLGPGGEYAARLRLCGRLSRAVAKRREWAAERRRGSAVRGRGRR